MAYLQARKNSLGDIVSYSIRVYRGKDENGELLPPFNTTFKVDPLWSEKTAYKKAVVFATEFEEQCKNKIIESKEQTFKDYSEYILSQKEKRGTKKSTLSFYREKSKRTYEAFGDTPISKIKPVDINKFYDTLLENGANKRGGSLSTKTILGYHRYISMVFEMAVKDDVIAASPAKKIEPPKSQKKTPNYYQLDVLSQIIECLEQEPFMWKVLGHLLITSGIRRGEALGLRWCCVDFENRQIHICRNVLYRTGYGTYVDTPKTSKSDRYIALPDYMMELLKKYKSEQDDKAKKAGGTLNAEGYLFVNIDGEPLCPDSVTTWFKRFSKRHDLPHVNAHAFRHTMASLLYFEGLDSVSISARLGHAQVSTTADIYAHIMAQADRRSSNIIDKVIHENSTSPEMKAASK